MYVSFISITVHSFAYIMGKYRASKHKTVHSTSIFLFGRFLWQNIYLFDIQPELRTCPAVLSPKAGTAICVNSFSALMESGN